jgi:hypothetical protein
MGLIVAPIPIGAKLVDTIATLTAAELAAFKAGGIEGVIAYLGGNLTQALLSECANQQIGVCPVNFSRGDPWTPTAALGTQDATNSVARLTALGVPTAGLVDWCDLEGAASDPTAYLNAWSTQLLSSKKGLIAGLYVGAGGLLTAEQLYALPGFTRYWRSLSNVPEPQCGFVLNQLYPTTSFAGVSIDYDFAQLDYEARSGTWLAAA